MSTPDRYAYDPEDYEREEWLREEYVEKGRSTPDIAAEFFVSHNKIRAELRRNGIETRPAPDRKPDHWDRRGETFEYVGPPPEPDDGPGPVDWSEVSRRE